MEIMLSEEEYPGRKKMMEIWIIFGADSFVQYVVCNFAAFGGFRL
jgi:hypothetical protein